MNEFSCFIPVFSEFLEKKSIQSANKFISSLMSLGVITYIGIAIIVIIFAHPIFSILVPGFNAEETNEIIFFTRLLIFSQIFFIFGTIATGVLQTLEHFILPGIAAALYNLGIIVGVLLFAPYFGIYGAVIGTFLGALLFFIFQLPLMYKNGFRFHFVFEIADGVKDVFHLMVPRSLTALVVQLSILVNLAFISFISARSIAIFELAQTIMFAPVNLFGQSIAQASIPSLAKKVNNPQEFVQIFVASFNQILYLTLPISVLFIVLRIPIVRLLYGTKSFDSDATVVTGMTLACFAISVAAQSLIYILSRAFFALKDTKTPFVITVISILINVVLSYVFTILLKKPVYYLAVSFSVANITSAVLMSVALHYRVKLPKLEVIVSVTKILIATLIMGFSLYIPIKLLDQLVFDTTRTINLIILTGISSFLGLLSFLFFTWLLEIKEAYYILAVVRKFSSRTPILKNISEIIDGPQLNS